MYEIKITKMLLKKVPAGEDWGILKEELYTDEELDRGATIYREADKTLPVKRKYGYTPKIEKEEHVEVDLLKQTVREIDLISIIKAINGIK